MSKIRACDNCGCDFTWSPSRQRHCSDQCAADFKRERERLRSRSRPKSSPRYWTRQCRKCGETFKQRGGDWFCSSGCRRAMSRMVRGGPVLGPDLPPLVDRPSLDELTWCRWCDLIVPPEIGKALYGFCSHRCRSLAGGWMEPRCDLVFGDCVECGKLMASDARQPRVYCSTRCRNRKWKRRERHLRRRNAGPWVEGVDLRAVAERDGWRCHLCGGVVPDRPWRARDRDPTLDHLVPVAAGGEHSMRNIALAHNRCNWERGAAGIAQLLLFG